MRDILVVSIVLPGVLAAFKWPWVGIMLWTWLSIMNPHRYTYGFAYDAPLAAMAAAATLVGLFFTREKESPIKGSVVTVFILFVVLITMSWLAGLDVVGDYEQWKKVMKIDLMILVSLSVLYSKKHIIALLWVAAGSLALLGAKGGVFTLLSGGNYRVWGPLGSFIEDNNEFALALVMTIPLLRFLQMQVGSWWGKQCLTVVMLLCALAALGSHSRGGMVAIAAMAVFLWWRGKNKFITASVLLMAVPILVFFMPEAWMERMTSIADYQSDRSAMGRISAWWTAWGIAWDYPLGVGFNAARIELFAKYSPYFSGSTHAAHSIYFQILGNHGFIGLGLFLTIWLLTWSSASWVRKHAKTVPEANWCADLASMCQVSLVGYAVGGAFLSLAYFDLPYDIMVLIVLTRVWIEKRGWEREDSVSPGWRFIPGLATQVRTK